ncbi:MAG: RNA polymerase sigma factor [Lachnospiraceae bacterium]|nr:RNA polymerase sigma factor [Lachnospiraceae bacterium]
MTEAKFEQCIRQMNEGNKEGLREVYEEYLSYIYGIVLQMIGNKENAEDITSEFFIRLWEKSASYKPGSGHRGWMATIARNMTIDFIRKYKREELTEEFEDVAQDDSKSSQIEAQVVHQMIIEDALATLSDKEREVIHMKVMGDMTLKEIAAVLQVPMGTVAWRYREAVNKLRRCGFEQGF